MIRVNEDYIEVSSNNSPSSIFYSGKLTYRNSHDMYLFYVALRNRIVLNERPFNMPVDMYANGEYVFVDGSGITDDGMRL